MTQDHTRTTRPRPSRTLRLSSQDFSQWGLDQAAYIRPAQVTDVTDAEDTAGLYAVHAADGRTLGVLEGRDHAIAAIVQQGMQPFSVH